jgi:hypothetical protein
MKIMVPCATASAGVGGEVQAAGRGVALHQLGQARLVDRHLAAPQRRHALGVHVQADHAVAHLGQAGRRHQADIAGTHHTHLHGWSCSGAGMTRAVKRSGQFRDAVALHQVVKARSYKRVIT